MNIAPKNWKEFQHYKDRSPQWIKLHRNLLDNFEFASLPVASRALAPMLWLLASEYEDGVIDASMEAIAFRLRMTTTELEKTLPPLISSGFFVTDSDLLAGRKRLASLEKERETEQETEGEIDCGASAPSKSKRASAFPKDFRLDEEAQATATRLGIPAARQQGVFDHFREHHIARGTVFKDWRAAWATWCRNDHKFGGQTNGGHHGAGNRRDDFSDGLKQLREHAAGGNRARQTIPEVQ